VLRKTVILAIALAIGMVGSATAMQPPPGQVSGVVWLDGNKNGVQDTGEPGVPGVAVVVRDSGGQPVGSATTDATGRYAAPAPGAGFAVCFGLPEAYADFLFTQGSGCVSGKPSVDAGIVSPPNRLGGAVWADLNKNGVRDGDEPQVPGVSVVVMDGNARPIGSATTGADGRYRVNNLPDGTFIVCFGMSTLPDAYADNLITRPNAAGDDLDSDADQVTGCTAPVNLGLGNRENLTVDAGTVAPSNRIGDFVWIDGDRNGVQDPGEPGVLGVTVVLKAAGIEAGRTTTNASGRYLFDNVPDGSYRVCVDLAALPAEVAHFAATEPDVGTDGTDSDADPAGCTPRTTVGVGRRADRTLDVGLIPPGGSASQG
jgi:SdrD B-like domain